MKSKLDGALKNLEKFEATKIEFCDKISSLNEEKLQAQMRESDLKRNIEEIQKVIIIDFFYFLKCNPYALICSFSSIIAWANILDTSCNKILYIVIKYI